MMNRGWVWVIWIVIGFGGAVAGEFRPARVLQTGPDLVIPAGAVELEIPNLMRGRYVAGADSFTLSFPSAEFTLRACIKIAILRKCFDLKEMRADAHSLEIDFGNEIANRRYEF